MKEIDISVICGCGFYLQRVFYTNEYGYFEISDSYCPDCFNFMIWEATNWPIDIIEVKTCT